MCEVSPQPSVRIDLVVALRCSVVHIENFAIKISASKTGAESLQTAYHFLGSTGNHESCVNGATGDRCRGVGHENGRAGKQIITPSRFDVAGIIRLKPL